MAPRERRVLAAAALLAAALGATLLLPAKSGGARGFDPLAEDVCVVAPPIPYDPASGADRYAPRAVPADARCPVCGMYPARSPRWAAQLIFRDGAVQYFDSPVTLFLFERNMRRYTSAYTRADVAVSFVTDAGSGAWTDARAAHFVHGSNASGPMRDGNLPAFASRAAAESFAAARGGKVLAATEVSDELLRGFDHGRHARHP